MKQEDEELLLKDLCARLPYGIKGRCSLDASYDTSFDIVYQTHDFDAELTGIKDDILDVLPLIEDTDVQEYACEEVADGIDVVDFKPYLRPLSSMTEDDIRELSKIDQKGMIFSARHLTYHLDGEIVDYLNRKMFDYRGLIERGLALKAPEGMYNN